MKRVPLSERLARRSIPVPMSGCLLWEGYLNWDGQGRIEIIQDDGSVRETGVHRVAWELANGPIPSGMVVCHKCDIPSCLNPDHLFLGTQIENMADRNAKGRTARGEKAGPSKLTEGEVRAIRAAAGPRNIIGRRFGVSTATVRNIQIGLTWRHV